MTHTHPEPLSLRNRLELSAAQADGNLSLPTDSEYERSLDKELGWIFYKAFSEMVAQEYVFKKEDELIHLTDEDVEKILKAVKLRRGSLHT